MRVDQCVNPWPFMLTGWLASLVFVSIVCSLATSFGDVGKAIGALVMVMQVAGSEGTLPVQMLPPLFQKLCPFLSLGMVLRKPLIPVNEWIEEKMEEAGLVWGRGPDHGPAPQVPC